jgi:glucosamine--fructose-6-phosphate aminotransferase (isomerizing)
MCGIVAYIGNKKASPILIKGLKRLEYRGYDSVGVALLESKLKVIKTSGKVEKLQAPLNLMESNATIGIGHTRWATHGEPIDKNSHPHLSGDGKIALVHNGIIENYAILKKDLISKGHIFKSDTDSEVLIHFIEDIQNQEECNLESALRLALGRIVGAYVIVLICEDEPETLYAARKGSPLVIGIGEGEHFLASDATPIVEYTNKVVYVNDYEIVIIKKNELILKNLNNESKTPFIEQLDLDLSEIEKDGYDHFMLKEIHEQPKTIHDCLRGRLNPVTGSLTLGGLVKYGDQLKNANRIIIIACGTSWHAGLVAEYIIEDLCRIPVEVEYASEFRYRNPVIQKGDVIIAISQSGETADTLVAMEEAKAKGALLLGVCNVVGSSIARLSDDGVYTHAGTEIGVASTKAFTAQLSVISLIALKIGIAKGTIEQSRYLELVKELDSIPEKVEVALKQEQKITRIAAGFKDVTNCLFLGRGFNFPIALEGALKLKEISYIHAEGYPFAEMKHGPIALIDEELPSIVIATKDKNYDKIISGIQEIKARKGKVIAIITEGDTVIPSMVDEYIIVPDVSPLLMPLVSVIPLQLLSYYVGIIKGCNVDQPRNLAKSVTVE